MSESLINTERGELSSYAKLILANHCIPTLLKAKPSNLVCVDRSKMGNEASFLRQMKQEIEQFQCTYSILFKNKRNVILLIYHPQLLKDTLFREENQRILQQYGYDCTGKIVSNVLLQFQHRYLNYCRYKVTFPHEIGIILGYPYQDVEDFIRYEGKNYLISGQWKVYHNMSSAQETFDLYNRMREDAKRIISTGGKLKELELSYALRNG